MPKSRNRKKKKQQNKVQQINYQAAQKPAGISPRSIIEKSTVISERYSGPLPPPKVLEYYNQIAPGAADRIISMAEKEQDHRHKIDDISNQGFKQYMSKGQWFSFILGLVNSIGGMILIYTGTVGIGASIFFFSLAILVGTAIWKFRSPISTENDDNNKTEKEPDGSL